MNKTATTSTNAAPTTRVLQHPFQRDLAAIVLGCLLMMFSLNAFATEPDNAASETATTENASPEKKAISRGITNYPVTATKDSNAALTSKRLALVPNKQRKGALVVQNKSALSPDFTIFDADISLYFDDDRDGHYYGIDVNFDADTDFIVADVYARLYLSLEGGDWEHYYTTEVFSIFDNTSDDDYTVETELFSGYPTGYYDVLIELYDADTDYLVAEFGPLDSSKTEELPLEDQQKDAGFVGSSVIVTHSRGGGGALSIPALALLLLVGVGRTLNARN